MAVKCALDVLVQLGLDLCLACKYHHSGRIHLVGVHLLCGNPVNVYMLFQIPVEVIIFVI